jgi:hypothetical protein
VQIFAEWVVRLNKQMGRQKRHILLIMDNAPSHKLGEHPADHGEY